nr:hypothetical protein CFP56_21565 [Quercus suber]
MVADGRTIIMSRASIESREQVKGQLIRYKVSWVVDIKGAQHTPNVEEEIENLSPFEQTDEPFFQGAWYARSRFLGELSVHLYPDLLLLRIRLPLVVDFPNNNRTGRLVKFEKTVAMTGVSSGIITDGGIFVLTVADIIQSGTVSADLLLDVIYYLEMLSRVSTILCVAQSILLFRLYDGRNEATEEADGVRLWNQGSTGGSKRRLPDHGEEVSIAGCKS